MSYNNGNQRNYYRDDSYLPPAPNTNSSTPSSYTSYQYPSTRQEYQSRSEHIGFNQPQLNNYGESQNQTQQQYIDSAKSGDNPLALIINFTKNAPNYGEYKSIQLSNPDLQSSTRFAPLNQGGQKPNSERYIPDFMRNFIKDINPNMVQSIIEKLTTPKPDTGTQQVTKYGKQTEIYSDLDNPNLYEDVKPNDPLIRSITNDLIKNGFDFSNFGNDDQLFLGTTSPAKIVSPSSKKSSKSEDYGFNKSITLKEVEDQTKNNSFPASQPNQIDNQEVVKPIFDVVPDTLFEKYDMIDKIRRDLGNRRFQDDKFTLETNMRDSQKYSKFDEPIRWQSNRFQWTHLSEIEKRTNTKHIIYDDTIHPNDIVQGKLGSCFFLSAISALAERPALVKRMFEGPNLHPSGAQAVWLNICGVWKQVTLDDYYPTLSDQKSFAFAHCRDQKLWVNLLEKAYAKAYGSYQAIDGGRAEDALKDLTGAPYSYFKEELKNPKDHEKLWNILMKYDQRGYPMVTGIDISGTGESIAGQSEQKRKNGLFEGHAYTLIGVAEVVASNGYLYKILQIRNPWGRGEWNGEWSDHSDLWTPELRKRLCSEKSDDGTFWIRFEDFCSQFDDIGICKIEPDFIYNYNQKKITFDRQTKSFSYVVHVKKAGKYYFSVDQKNSKVFMEKNSPFTRIEILKAEENNKVILKGASSGFDRNQNVSMKLIPGTYVVLIDITLSEFPPPAVASRKVTFSTYGVETTSIQPVYLSKKEMVTLEMLAFGKVIPTITEGWKRSKLKCSMPNNEMTQDVYPFKDAGMKFHRNVFSHYDKNLCEPPIEIQIDPQTACDYNDEVKVFYMDMGQNPIYYSKTNDTSTTSKPNMNDQNMKQYSSHYELPSILQAIFEVKSDFPVVSTEDERLEIPMHNELEGSDDEEQMNYKTTDQQKVPSTTHQSGSNSTDNYYNNQYQQQQPANNNTNNGYYNYDSAKPVSGSNNSHPHTTQAQSDNYYQYGNNQVSAQTTNNSYPTASNNYYQYGNNQQAAATTNNYNDYGYYSAPIQQYANTQSPTPSSNSPLKSLGFGKQKKTDNASNSNYPNYQQQQYYQY